MHPGFVGFWYSLPVLAAIAAAGAGLVVVAPFGTPADWSIVGAGGTFGGGLGAIIALASRHRPTWMLLGLAALGLGIWRGAAVVAEPVEPWSDAPSQNVRLWATVDAPVETRGAIATILARIDSIESPDSLRPPGGRLQIITPALPPVELGDAVEIEGRIRPIDRNDPRERRLLARGVVATALFPDLTPLGMHRDGGPIGAIQELRAGIETTIGRLLPEPQAALLVGLLVGSGSGMPDGFRQALVAAGLTHVVVASGYNVTLVAGALRNVFRFPRPFGLLPPLVGVAIFTVLAGATAPSLRAAIMATVALFVLSTGRGTDALLALALAASVMVLLDPQLIADLSFQLSALATLGLIALSPRIAALMPRIPGSIAEPLSTTIAAQVATTPLLVLTFFQVSLLAPLTNVLVAPLIPITTIGGAICVAVAAAIPAATAILGALLFLPTGIIVAVAESSAALPSALVAVGAVPAMALTLYAIGLLCWAIFPTPEGRQLLELARSPRLAVAVVVLPVTLVGASLAAPGAAGQPYLIATVLDVGEGNAVFIRTPGGRTIFIDGGSNPSAALSQVGRRLGPLERELSVAVLTGQDQARLPGAIAVAERYAVSHAFAPPQQAPSALAKRWNAVVSGRTHSGEEPVNLELEPGVILELWPTVPVAVEQANPPLQRTYVARISYGTVSLLLAPSLTPDAAQALLAAGTSLATDVLLVPRAGDGRGLNSDLLAAIDPSVAIIAVGARNRSLPASEVLSLLGEIPTYRTDRHGSIEVRTDGARLWLIPERPEIRPG
jgi:competence protein ComEC